LENNKLSVLFQALAVISSFANQIKTYSHIHEHVIPKTCICN